MGAPTRYRFPFAAYPAVRLALLFSGGIAAQYHLRWDESTVLGVLLPAVLLYWTAERLSGKTLFGYSYHISVALYLGVIFTFGVFWQSRYDYRVPPGNTSQINRLVWESFLFSGRTYRVSPARDGGSILELSIDTIMLNDTLPYLSPVQLRAYADEPPDRFRPGDRMRFTATIYPLEGPRNPRQFDYRDYLARKGIYLHAGVDSIHSITPNKSTPLDWAHLRRSVLDRIGVLFNSENRALAKAVLIGYKKELDREQRRAFSRAGLSHIMAVSGLHVGFIIAPFWLIIPFFWTYRYGRQAGLLVLVALLTTYAGITGFSPSVTRASLTGAFICYGRLFHKKRTTVNLTAAAAFLILLANPNELFNIGFQLSYWAVYVILLTLPAVNRWLPERVRYGWAGIPARIVIVSALVQAGLYPLLGYYFGEFSLVGPLLNAFVVPVLGLAVPCSLVLLVISYPLPGMAGMLNLPNRWMLDSLQWLVEWMAGVEWSWIRVRIEDPAVFLLWILAILLIASLHQPRLRWKGVILLLTLIAVHTLVRTIHKQDPSTLSVTVFDVGQGDAIYIRTPRGKNIMIDAGRWSPSNNSGERIILPYLRRERIDTLHALVLTHPHADHMGGAPSLIDAIPVDTIYHPGYPYESDLYRRTLASARRAGIPVLTAGSGTVICIDSSIRIFAYGPRTGPFGGDPNEHSLVVELVHGENEFLFTGDAGIEQEHRLLSDYGDLLDADFLKVGHHGSRTASSEEFLSTVSPEIAVISLDLRNRFGHPHPDAVRRLRDTGAELYFTSLDRTQIFESDGETIKRRTWQ